MYWYIVKVRSSSVFHGVMSNLLGSKWDMVGVMTDDNLVLYDVYTGRLIRWITSFDDLRLSHSCVYADVSKIKHQGEAPSPVIYNDRIDKDRTYSAIISCLEGECVDFGYRMMEDLVPGWNCLAVKPIRYTYNNEDFSVDNFLLEMKLLSKAVCHLATHSSTFKDRVLHAINSRYKQDDTVEESRTQDMVVDKILDCASRCDHLAVSRLVLDLNVCREKSNVKYATYNPIVLDTTVSELVTAVDDLKTCIGDTLTSITQAGTPTINLSQIVSVYNKLASIVDGETLTIDTQRHLSTQGVILVDGQQDPVIAPLADRVTITIPPRGAPLGLLDTADLELIINYMSSTSSLQPYHDSLRRDIHQELSRRRRNRDLGL